MAQSVKCGIHRDCWHAIGRVCDRMAEALDQERDRQIAVKRGLPHKAKRNAGRKGGRVNAEKTNAARFAANKRRKKT